MKIGMSMLLWTPQVTAEHMPILEQLADLGFDGVEVPVTEGEDHCYAELHRMLEDTGLERTAVTFATASTNPVSPDPSIRQAAVDHLRRMIDRAADLGCAFVGGPVHSAYSEFTGAGPTEEEFSRCAEVLRAAGEHAAERDVKLGVEYLNRFECYFATTAAQAAALVRQVELPSVRLVYDTHHAHLEEDDAAAALRGCADVLGHVQLSENHRGALGRGQVAWDQVFSTLKEVHYDDWLVVESFSRHDPELGANLRIWRDFATSTMDLAREGIAFVQRSLAENTGR